MNSPPVCVRAAGMVTAVGLDVWTSCAAMRARLDGFRESRFVGPAGDWLVAAEVPLPRSWIGQKRLAHLAAGAIADIFGQMPGMAEEAVLFLCLAEESRPGRPVVDSGEFARQLSSIIGLTAATKTRVISHGRPSGFVALDRATGILRDGSARAVILLGVDSFLTKPTIEHYLKNQRLLTPINANGFIPGEAAAAVLCTLGGGGLALAGLGLGREEAHIYNGLDQDGLDIPLRGEGMIATYDMALGQAGIDYGRIGYRVADWTGEKHYFQQSALSEARHLRTGYHAFQDVLNPAESVGNVGAAVAPLMLGQALMAARNGYAGGDTVLIEGSGDDGACAAAILNRVEGQM